MSQPLHTLSPADLPLRIGRYELTDVLGQGGMARVFLAELVGPAGFRKQVALKVVAPWKAELDESLQGQFLREARLGGLLKHPNIVDVYELGELQGSLYLAMELVKGPSLLELLRRRRPLPGRAVLELAIQLCAGLAHAHELQVDGRASQLVHRDLKPGNVLLTPEGLAKIADFGIAQVLAWKAEAPGRFQGTPSYAPPEQIAGRPVDSRADLFSLAALLYLCSTGDVLFPARSPRVVQGLIAELEQSIVAGQEPLRAADAAVPGLGQVLERALRSDPRDRLSGAGEFALALEHLFEPQLAGPSLAVLLQPAGRAAASSLRLPIIPRSPAPQLEVSLLSEPQDRFIGRKADLAKLRGRLARARLVTVKGPAGVGKTRLAREAMRALQPELPAGSWFVDLSLAREAEGVPRLVAEELGLPARGLGPDSLARAVGRSLADRPACLLLLDTFEHVLGAASHVEDWLARAPGLRVLVTSRSPLKLQDEDLIELGPLSSRDASALFRDRSGLARTGPAEKRLLARLDRLPLAIELAAARASAEGIEAIEVLERRLDRDGQAPLRAAVAWSWELLSGWEQRALAQLSTFRGGFDGEAAEAVVMLGPTSPFALDLVQSLLEKSLLHAEGTEAGPRFFLYKAVRAFAGDQLRQRGELATTEERHGAWYARFGLDERIDALDMASGRQAVLRVGQERGNLRAAVDRALARGDSTTAVQAALAELDLAERRGPQPVAARRAMGLLKSGLDLPPGLELRLRRAAGRLLVGSSDIETGMALLEQALAAAQLLGERRLEGRILSNLGAGRIRAGQLEEAQGQLAEALAVHREVGDRVAEGRTLGWYAALLRDQGRVDEALVFFRRAFAIDRAVGNMRLEGYVSGLIANLHRRRGQLEEAEPLYQHALNLLRATGSTVWEAQVRTNFGLHLAQRGELRGAEAVLRDAVSANQRTGTSRSTAIALANLAEVLAAQGRLGPAMRELESALALVESLGLSALEGAFLALQGDLLRRDGDLTSALVRLDRAEEILRSRPARREELGKALAWKGAALQAIGELAAAQAAFDEAEQVQRQDGAGPDSELARMLRELQDATDPAPLS